MGDAFRAPGPVLQIGVVGCGPVGSAICRGVDEQIADARLHAVYDADASKMHGVIWGLKQRPQGMTLAGVAATSDLVVEATTVEEAADVVRLALDNGKDVLVTNPAGLVGREEFARVAAERGVSIRLSCDILVGLDGARAAAGGTFGAAVLTVTGPPAFFAAQPAGRKSGVDLRSLGERAQVFHGTGADALQALPQLANPIAVLCYAGRGFGQTTVVALADPTARLLTCRIEARSGDLSIASESRLRIPSKGVHFSPLVALSAVAALRRAVESLVVG